MNAKRTDEMGAKFFWYLFTALLVLVVANRYRRIDETKKIEKALKFALFCFGLFYLSLFVSVLFIALFVGFPDYGIAPMVSFL